MCVCVCVWGGGECKRCRQTEADTFPLLFFLFIFFYPPPSLHRDKSTYLSVKRGTVSYMKAKLCPYLCPYYIQLSVSTMAVLNPTYRHEMCFLTHLLTHTHKHTQCFGSANLDQKKVCRLLSNVPRYLHHITLFERPQIWPACPSELSIMNMTMNTEH